MSVPAGDAPLSVDSLPPALLNRCMEYQSLPQDQQVHLLRHSDSPAIYRQGAKYLWTSLQQHQLAESFPNGWWLDPTHPFMQCTGEVRLFPSRTRRLSVDARAASTTGEFKAPPVVVKIISTVGEQMKRSEARPFVMSDISPYLTLQSSASFLWLHDGPSLFQPFNLLAATPSTIKNPDETTTTVDHTLAQFNLASRGTHTNTHTDWYGTDGVVHLLEGEKLWLMAPPEHYDAFDQLFPSTDHFSLDEVERFQQLYQLSGSCAVHQHAGDIISVPAGWVHAVINLTNTASFGYSYLRPWKLHSCLKWAKERGEVESLSMVNLDGVFEHTLLKALPPNPMDWIKEEQRPFWGLSATQIQEARAAWKDVQKYWISQKKLAKANAEERAANATAAAALQRLHQPQQQHAAAASTASTMKD